MLLRQVDKWTATEHPPPKKKSPGIRVSEGQSSLILSFSRNIFWLVETAFGVPIRQVEKLALLVSCSMLWPWRGWENEKNDHWWWRWCCRWDWRGHGTVSSKLKVHHNLWWRLSRNITAMLWLLCGHLSLSYYCFFTKLKWGVKSMQSMHSFSL